MKTLIDYLKIDLESIHDEMQIKLKECPEYLSVRDRFNESLNEVRELDPNLMKNLDEGNAEEISYIINKAYEVGFKHGLNIATACCQD